MRMINKIMRAMRDTGLLDGMSDEDVDTIATAALEALRAEQSYEMKLAGSKEWKANPMWFDGTFGVASSTFIAMIDAALNE